MKYTHLLHHLTNWFFLALNVAAATAKFVFRGSTTHLGIASCATLALTACSQGLASEELPPLSTTNSSTGVVPDKSPHKEGPGEGTQPNTGLVLSGATYAWEAGGDRANMGSIESRACMLTKIAGNFDGGELSDDASSSSVGVAIFNHGGEWALSGSATAAGAIRAEARCIEWTQPAVLQDEVRLLVSADNPTQQAANTGRSYHEASANLANAESSSCFLQRVGGNFGLTYDASMIVEQNGQRLLQVRAESTPPIVNGAARCIDRAAVELRAPADSGHDGGYLQNGGEGELSQEVIAADGHFCFLSGVAGPIADASIGVEDGVWIARISPQPTTDAQQASLRVDCLRIDQTL